MALTRDRELAKRAAEILKAVAHPDRLRLVAVLCAGPRNVTELASGLDLPQAIVSQHLRILRSHALVAAVREQGFATYRILEPHLHDMLKCVTGCVVTRRGRRP